MSTHPTARCAITSLAKLSAIALAFFLMGFLGISYFLGLGYCDDRAQLAGNHPIAADTQASTGNLGQDAQLEMQIRFALRRTAELDSLVEQQQKPGSASYHQWLKTGQFFERFGPAKSDVTAVSAWLTNEGFKVTEVTAGHLSFNGSVDQTQRTFTVNIARFGAGDGFANRADPFIPNRFTGVIASVTGLDNMIHSSPVSQHTNDAVAPEAIVSGVEAFGPADFRTFYDENAGPGEDGNGDCIAIVGVSDFLDSAMTAFTTQFNLPPISYTRELHGANPGINGAEVEAELDLQWAHSAAPAATIVFHLGGYLVDDITGAVSDNQCGAISISYGFCGPSPAFITGIIHPLFEQAAAQGQSVFVSSGDQGVAGLGYDPATNACVAGNSPSVNEMSADPNVTSVGGTQFTPRMAGGTDLGYTIESVWNDASGASGGGASQIFSKPAYQTGSGVPNDGARDVPDVAMMASPNSPGAFFGHDASGIGQVMCCVGGTSLSAPLWGAFSRVVAEIVGQTRLGNLNTIIYQLANQQLATAGFHEVLNGNNAFNGLPGFNAGPGYNQAAGWGTVDFEVFAKAVKNLLDPSASPSATPTATATPTPTAAPTPSARPTGGVLGVPASVTFPATASGRPGSIKTVVIQNLSRSTTLGVNVGTLVPPFIVSGAGSHSVAPGSSTSITILFSPATGQVTKQSLQITSSDPGHPQAVVQVAASVRGGKLSMPASVSLRAALNSSATATVVLKNSGHGTLSGTVQPFGAGSAFTLLGAPVSFSLAPGRSQSVTIQFRPASSAAVQASLGVALVEPAGSASIAVSGSAH